jgi:prolyl oligopeptidase
MMQTMMSYRRRRKYRCVAAALMGIMLLSKPYNAIAAESATRMDPSSDPYLWLEDVTGERALKWVHEQNALSTEALEASPDFEPIRQRLLEILNSQQRIPYVEKHGKFLYNFWRDSAHVRGLWRRTTMDEYRKAEPAWESVIDLDQLATAEKENWVWKNVVVLEPDYDRCIVKLSRAGADAVVAREFDLTGKQFVADGFALPEAKSDVTWRDRDALYVGTDFGAGSLTESGYPRVVKLWLRKTPLSDAKLVFQGQTDDVIVSPDVVHDHGRVYEFIERDLTAFTSEMRIRRGDDWVKIDKPADAEVDTYCDDLLLRLRSDWSIQNKTYRAGTLLAINFDSFLKGDRNFQPLFEPTGRKSLASISATKSFLVLNEMDNVRGRPILLSNMGGAWKRTAVAGPPIGTVDVIGVDAEESDEYFFNVDDFLTPSSLYLGVAPRDDHQLLKQLPSFFNSAGLQSAQYETVSKDGTRVPYFLVSRKDMKLDGGNPTLLYGYGGFEISMQPGYRPGVGSAWLDRGGAYALANIRGGGEFGPAWHNAARMENRQKAYDDFEAVAEDLIARKITSPKHLGIQGGSNGGLLMGVMLTQRPDLFGAVVCQAPLLDMRRYNQLLAGASWMDEYGNPDLPADWAYMQKYSPYQNASKDRQYPPVLFTTSTRDDRVHPGHARKMAALLEEQGHDVLFYENTEGGHSGSANNRQTAFMNALAYTFLLKELQ